MKKAIPWLVLLVLLIAAGAWYFWPRETAGSHPSVVPLPEAPPVTEAPAVEFPAERIQAQPGPGPEPEPLPALADSDAAAAEALAGLVGPESLGAYFVTDRVISRIVATIDSLTSRQVAPLVMALRPVGGNFLVQSEGESLTASPENQARYSAYVRLARALDTRRLAAEYVRLYPLFQEAYQALGYPDAHFNDRLVEVIDHLLATPEVTGPVRLVRPEAVYLFEDQALESLSAGQKILTRIGPDNAAVIRAKLEEIRSAVRGPVQLADPD